MKYILLAFISLNALASSKEPLHHYHDRVRITRGFYQGCEGTVEDVHTQYESKKLEYTVHSYCKGGDLSFDVPEELLELVIFEDPQ